MLPSCWLRHHCTWPHEEVSECSSPGSALAHADSAELASKPAWLHEQAGGLSTALLVEGNLPATGIGRTPSYIRRAQSLLVTCCPARPCCLYNQVHQAAAEELHDSNWAGRFLQALCAELALGALHGCKLVVFLYSHQDPACRRGATGG